MNAHDALILARKHIGNGAAHDASARSCLEDAVNAENRGDLTAAKKWAVKSLAYSVGVFHYDYRRASSTATVRESVKMQNALKALVESHNDSGDWTREAVNRRIQTTAESFSVEAAALATAFAIGCPKV